MKFLHSKRFLLIFALANIFVSTSVASQNNNTLSITDDRNVTVEVPAKPQRIAAISYLAVDVGLALGIKPVATTYMIPGRDPDFLGGLTKNIKKIGQRARPNLELLSETKPDTIIAIKRYTAANAEQLQKIAPYVAYNMELLNGSYKEVAEVAKIMGYPERGKQLNEEFKQHLANYLTKVSKDKHPSFVIMWAGSYSAFHDEQTAASIMTALGGKNIMGSMPVNGRFTSNISLETLLEKNPDIIIVLEWLVDDKGNTVRTHEDNPIWKQLSAVKNGRVIYAGDEWSEANGPIAREILLKESAHYLYPEIFPKIDVKAEALKMIPVELHK
ncbi:ABC transporter substrate-binding protein [Pelistega sp. MC2]|uniref:ABC transporter substrate-binding protein n=1 Tax=Pelistega sp. MC2 TaxID=1720297 RepID=UPI0008D9331E|nr:ABC transporter substrate-binding protein [Pelistega sp. MC2]